MGQSLNSKDLFVSIISLVHREYTKRGHNVDVILADAQQHLKDAFPCAAVNIDLKNFEPGAHELLVGAHIGKSNQHDCAILVCLSYFLPAQYESYVYQ